MLKYIFFSVLLALTNPLGAEAKTPTTMPELFAYLGTDEAVFASCGFRDINHRKGLNAFSDLKHTCWDKGKEGGKIRSTSSDLFVYHKNGTGYIEARGHSIPFTWKQNGAIIHRASEIGKFNDILQFGIYLTGTDNPEDSIPFMLQNAKNKNFLKKIRSLR